MKSFLTVCDKASNTNNTGLTSMFNYSTEIGMIQPGCEKGATGGIRPFLHLGLSISYLVDNAKAQWEIPVSS